MAKSTRPEPPAARDEAIWLTLDDTSHLTARELADAVGCSPSLAHQSLGRLVAEGRAARDDRACPPFTWVAVGAEDDDPGVVVLSEADAELVAHLLRWLVNNDHVGDPTRALLTRVEAGLEKSYTSAVPNCQIVEGA